MKDKMVLNCLKPKQALSPKNKVCSHSQQKRFKCLRQFKKMHLEKIVKQNEETVLTEKISC